MSFRNLSRTFRYVNENGDSITFEYENGFLINKPRGIDTVSIQHRQAQGINQVGSTIQSSNVQARPVVISGKLVGDYQSENKTKLLSVIRPDLSARLYADDYYLEVRPSATPTIEPKKQFAAFQLSLLAAYPYWQKDESSSVELRSVIKRFRFPWYLNGTGGGQHEVMGYSVSFNAPGEAEVVSMTTAITPVQSGSGDPSPSNVRPISGFSAANIVVSPTTTAGDGTTYTVSFGSASTVYSGSLNVTTGELTIDHQMFLFDGSDTSNWTVNNSNYFQRRRPTGFSETTSGYWAKKFYSNALETTERSGSAGSIKFNSFYAGSTYLAVRIDSFNHDLTTFQSFLTNTGLQILVPIAEQTVQLTPTEVQLLLGTNNVWSDTGYIDMVYEMSGTTTYRFGEVVQASYINVKNDGQVPVPFTVTLKALAPVVNPKLTDDDDTSRFLLLNKSLVAGETVVVEITHERTYVSSSVDGECRGALDLSSSLFRLKVGDNVIKPSADSGLSNLQMNISYSTEVVGVAL